MPLYYYSMSCIPIHINIYYIHDYSKSHMNYLIYCVFSHVCNTIATKNKLCTKYDSCIKE